MAAPAWARVEVLPEAASTNAVVTERAQQGAEHGLVVVADHQTAGRGRLGRTWVTPPGAALTFSVLVRPGQLGPGADSRSWPLLPLMTGVAVAEGLEAGGAPRCALKWPNDVMDGDLKLGGLLAERVETPSGPAAVLGVGVNVSTLPGELPVPTATSLLLGGAAGLDRGRLLLCVLDCLGERLQQWARGDEHNLLEDYRARCSTLGRVVRVDLPGGTTHTGTAVRVDKNGALVLRDGPRGARETTVSAGDVLHVRPADEPTEVE